MPVRSILLAALLFGAAPATAQQQAIESQMTPDEFKAAGLDKLSAEELSRLNAWLGRAIEGETTRAASEAREQAKESSRGFLNIGSGANEPIESRLTGQFSGFAKGRLYTLENGQVWRQIDDARLAGVRLDSPAMRLNQAVIGNAWYLRVEGYNTRAKVERVK